MAMAMPTLPAETQRPQLSELLDVNDLINLRYLRAEVQDLQAVLDSVRKGKANLSDYNEYLHKTRADIERLMPDIQPGDDNMRHVRNLWEQMRACPLLKAPQQVNEPKDLLRYVDALDVQIDSMVFLIGCLTIHSRLTDWVRNAQPGQTIYFHLVFADEIASAEQRQRLLNLLAFGPPIDGGLIDPEAGVVYRYDTNRQERLRSYRILIEAMALTVALVFLLAVLPVPGWRLQPADLSTLLPGWGALLVGTLVHVAIAGQKRSQQQDGEPRPSLPMRNWTLLINARLSDILFKLVLALVGFFGLVFASGVGNVTVLNCFLVGYSLDSVIELFRASLDQKGANQVTSLKKSLGAD